MIILGISHPVSWNNAACVLVDGQLVAMVEEERLSRIKHAPHVLARRAIAYCLQQAGVALPEVDCIAVGFERATQVAVGALRSDNLLSGLNQAARWYSSIKPYERLLSLPGVESRRFVYVNHHLAHAASAFFASGFADANILSLDGSGGSESGILAVGRGPDIHVIKTVPNRGSWGLSYELITEKLGFRRHSGEGKVMGLAAYGTPDPNGLPFVRWDCEIPQIDPVGRRRFLERLQTRTSDEILTDKHRDLAATLQYTLEHVAVRMVEWLHKQTGLRRLCLAGGTALNCSMNGKLAVQPCVDEIFVQPAAYDAGTALGAALTAHIQMTGGRPDWRMEHAYWGPEYSNNDIEQVLRESLQITYHKSADVCAEAAELLSQGKIVGWHQGRSEVGPRALGNRSIIADPSRVDMKDRINNQVKHREPWRPFAPSILEEVAGHYVATPMASPYMILAFDTLPSARAEIISATHIDFTCRPQTVNSRTNPRFWQLIKRFSEHTGIPAVLNTSFNVDSQPIVNTPAEAVDTFLHCGLEALAIGDFIGFKKGS